MQVSKCRWRHLELVWSRGRQAVTRKNSRFLSSVNAIFVFPSWRSNHVSLIEPVHFHTNFKTLRGTRTHALSNHSTSHQHTIHISRCYYNKRSYQINHNALDWTVSLQMFEKSSGKSLFAVQNFSRNIYAIRITALYHLTTPFSCAAVDLTTIRTNHRSRPLARADCRQSRTSSK